MKCSDPFRLSSPCTTPLLAFVLTVSLPAFVAAQVIDRVEFVQTIQTLQTLDDLQKSLAASGQPPVPMLADKLAAMRIYTVAGKGAYTINVTVPGGKNLPPLQVTLGTATVDSQRYIGGPATAVQTFTPPEGAWKATLTVLDKKKAVVQGPITFEFSKTQAQKKLNLQLVFVCDATAANGDWLCPNPRTLSEAALKFHAGYISAILPAQELTQDRQDGKIEVDMKKFAGAAAWFTEVLKQIALKVAVIEKKDAPAAGILPFYLGLTRPETKGNIAGMAGGIPSRTALALAETMDLGKPDTSETWAHEIGHGLNLRHTNLLAPMAKNDRPPGCYLQARDGSAAAAAQWPFMDNRIQSAVNVVEVGYRPDAKQIVKQGLSADNMLELMAYCFPQWISPIKYNAAAATLAGTAALSGLVRTQEAPHLISSNLNYWTVSGTISNGQAVLDPLFISALPGPASTGSGAYTIQLTDPSGAILFQYQFDPIMPVPEQPVSDSVTADPYFYALVPQYTSAARMRVLDPSGALIGEKSFSNNFPLVQLSAPAANANLSRVQTASWTVAITAGLTLTSRVEYSPNMGSTWYDLGRVAGFSLPIDYDALPGTSGNTALLRVSVSDGANVGAATSAAFSVAKKLPVDPVISEPAAGAAFAPDDPILLEGGAYDGDDGILGGAAVRWSSSIDGDLGAGQEMLVPQLSAGHHVITMTATDSDGNATSETTTVNVAANPPAVAITLQSTPAGCVATINVQEDANVGLTSAGYSLNGGAVFIPVAPGRLPLNINIRGAATVDMIARATDQAGELGATEVLISPSSCSFQ